MKLIKVFGAGLSLGASMLAASPTMAADASTAVGAYSGNLDSNGDLLNTIFEDDIWGFDPTGAGSFDDVAAGGPVISFATIQAVANGVPGQLTLNPASKSGPQTNVENFAIEAILSGTVDRTFIEEDSFGNDRFGYAIMRDVRLDLYFGDNTNNSTINSSDTLLTALPKFNGSQLDTTLVATFETESSNDFYVIKFDLQSTGNPIMAFQFGLTETFRDSTQLGNIDLTNLTANVHNSADLTAELGGPAVRRVSIYGAGGNEDPISGVTHVGDFLVLDGNFSAAIVPTPAAAGLGFMVFGMLGLTRPVRRDAID